MLAQEGYTRYQHFMDFLDPKKTKRHTALLFAGYILIAIGVVIATVVLIYQANGFGVNGKGQVVQNGLVFVSSQPNPAQIYLNNELSDKQTNSRLSLPAGRYDMRLERDGYRPWQRTITVQGGDVQNYVYPFLVPAALQTDTIHTLPDKPGLTTHSNNRRWLVAQQSQDSLAFSVYDLQNPKDAPESFSIPSDTVTAGKPGASWRVVEWANNNRHVLFKRSWSDGFEYILFDRQNNDEAVNLSAEFPVSLAKLALTDNAFNRYHLLSTDNILYSAQLGSTQVDPVAEQVLAFKTYGTKQVLYATTLDAPDDKVSLVMRTEDNVTKIRDVSADTTYHLDVAGYQNDQYVVVAAQSEGMAYVYKNPVDQISRSVTVPSASRAVKVPNVSHVGFSPNAQYVLAQGGTTFGVYDLKLRRAYVYALKQPMDSSPTNKASWVDSHHLTYVSNKQSLLFDYDKRNQQQLVPALGTYGDFYAPDYRFVYAVVVDDSGAYVLTQTPLRTEADL